MLDPEFAPRLLELPDVGDVEVVGTGSGSSGRWLSVRMVYDGSLDPIAARVLGSSSPSWIQTYRFDTGGQGALTISPEHHEQLLRCHATVTLREEGDGTRRLMIGELTVRVPLLGGRAERALAPAILRRIDVEAELLVDWLNAR